MSVGGIEATHAGDGCRLWQGRAERNDASTVRRWGALAAPWQVWRAVEGDAVQAYAMDVVGSAGMTTLAAVRQHGGDEGSDGGQGDGGAEHEAGWLLTASQLTGTRSRLRCTQALPGASVGQTARWHYVVETDVLPDMAAEFDAWYAEEHLPGLAAVPGTVYAQRWQRVSATGVGASDAPFYLACYGLVSLETFGSPAWLAVRATDWSSSVRPAFRNTRRTMYRPWASGDGR